MNEVDVLDWSQIVKRQLNHLGGYELEGRIRRAKVNAANSEFLSGMLPVLLPLLPDVERRASLHLRFCLEFPSVASLCCQHRHCFKVDLERKRNRNREKEGEEREENEVEQIQIQRSKQR